jgi:hypothetical protein
MYQTLHCKLRTTLNRTQFAAPVNRDIAFAYKHAHNTMNLTILLLATFAVMVACCPPLPYKRRRSSSNHTLLKDRDTLDDYNPATGWMHNVGVGSQAQPWPRGSDGIVRIKYCFHDEKSKTTLASHIEKALQKWFTRLGEPSKQHGHVLAKPEEHVKDGKPIPCRKGTEWSKLSGMRKHERLLMTPRTIDSEVPDETFEIYITDEEIPGATATLGYWAEHP